MRPGPFLTPILRASRYSSSIEKAVGHERHANRDARADEVGRFARSTKPVRLEKLPGDVAMQDVIFVGLTLVLFALSFGAVAFCQKL